MDNCSFTCNTGYKLVGSDARMCQSNGVWNGTETMCKRGKYKLQVLYYTYMYAFTIVFILYSVSIN